MRRHRCRGCHRTSISVKNREGHIYTVIDNRDGLEKPMTTMTRVTPGDLVVFGGPVLPGNPPQPWPELLTTEEAVRSLRLDEEGGPKRPDKTLQYYSEKRSLKGIKVGKRIRYRRVDLDAFLVSLAN